MTHQNRQQTMTPPCSMLRCKSTVAIFNVCFTNCLITSSGVTLLWKCKTISFSLTVPSVCFINLDVGHLNMTHLGMTTLLRRMIFLVTIYNLEAMPTYSALQFKFFPELRLFSPHQRASLFKIQRDTSSTIRCYVQSREEKFSVSKRPEELQMEPELKKPQWLQQDRACGALLVKRFKCGLYASASGPSYLKVKNL